MFTFGKGCQWPKTEEYNLELAYKQSCQNIVNFWLKSQKNLQHTFLLYWL